jgi:hypothetical protein
MGGATGGEREASSACAAVDATASVNRARIDRTVVAFIGPIILVRGIIETIGQFPGCRRRLYWENQIPSPFSDNRRRRLIRNNDLLGRETSCRSSKTVTSAKRTPYVARGKERMNGACAAHGKQIATGTRGAERRIPRIVTALTLHGRRRGRNLRLAWAERWRHRVRGRWIGRWKCRGAGIAGQSSAAHRRRA